MRLLRSLTAFVLYTIVCVQPALANTETRELVHKLWAASGGDALLERIKTSMVTGEDNLLLGLEGDNAQKISAIVEQNFVNIKAHMLAYMAQHGRSTTLKQAYNFLDTPLGAKLVKLNLNSQSLFNDPEVGIPISRDDLSRERADMQTRFVKIMYATVNTYLSGTQEHFMTLHNHIRPPQQRLTDQELEQQIKLASVKVGGITTQLLPHVFTRTFAELSLEELTVYLNYLDSEGGKHVNDLMLDAYLDALKTTRPPALLSLSKLFEDELSILSPYSKEKLTDAKQRELMAMLIKQHSKATIIRAMLEARAGQMTIMTPDNDTKEVYGRPNQELVTLDTLMKDLDRSGMDIRRFYQIVQKKMRSIN